MPISPQPFHRPIDIGLAPPRERLTVIAAIDREAIEIVSRDPTIALRFALLASELRRQATTEVAP
jgi:hypothetical protein